MSKPTRLNTLLVFRRVGFFLFIVNVFAKEMHHVDKRNWRNRVGRSCRGVATTVFSDRDVDVASHIVPRAGGTLNACRADWI